MGVDYRVGRGRLTYPMMWLVRSMKLSEQPGITTPEHQQKSHDQSHVAE